MSPRFRAIFFVWCAACIRLSGGTPAPPAVAPGAFSYAHVIAEARTLAGAAYMPERERVPRFYLELFAEQFREIRFRRERSIWEGTDSPWRVSLLHPGLFFNRVARVFVVEAGAAREIVYDTSRFSFGKLPSYPGEKPVGHAGFGLRSAENAGEEFVLFGGGAYFRGIPVGVGAMHGVSARGIVVNPAVEGHSEEFPFFKKYWVERQASGAAQAVVYALMDSPHVCGAFRFVISPGRVSVVEVDAVLFARERMRRLGLAPLSAMFWYGENSLRRPEDYRPEVHSADGLLVVDAGGRAWWRPLSNGGAGVRRSVFAVDRLAGFGLRQRDTAFGSYQDLEGAFHRRPGVWVEPLEGCPPGAVHLLEYPTSQDAWDNVVCYWEPKVLPAPGAKLHLRYRVSWAMEDSFRGVPGGLARVLSTHVGRRGGEGRVLNYVVDFSPVASAGAPPVARVRVSGGGRLLGHRLALNPETHGWRLWVEVGLSGAGPHGVSAVLRSGEREVSEVWDYLSPAEQR
ncbi:MAG: glucan biosynthesis protein [Puniceicoccales bacterium]|jgi:glucans biosynthesis protein|nr:glucan biosynthesis protein [Puniceicoccales bacterium]